ncbi:co-chaperone GroES [Candidatus Profftia lariciata]|uniref:co-chaperone GroES n=1 Tax=Candidatus Profftia lariciata TaxID=1987921 RepID=UPI001D024F83|nr:co-chaperone GroES [Candidatus Profftia lariciata]
MKSNIRLLHDHVVIKRQDVDTKSTSGIVLTRAAANKSTRGLIIAVGKGRILENSQVKPLEVQAGNIVIFNNSYSIKIENIDNEELLIILESDILAILDT